jgi:hypothetical protein
MTHDANFNFWYAVHNTHVLLSPSSSLETFGNTTLNYHLVTEQMDTAEKIRIREGRVKAFRPEILTPNSFLDTILEGFGEEANAYGDWLRKNEQELCLLKYGFKIAKEHISEEIVTGTLEQIAQEVKESVSKGADPLAAVVVGVEKPWEVCLLKLMIDVVQKSSGPNIQDFRDHGIYSAEDLSLADQKSDIEQTFRQAERDPSRMQGLYEKLQNADVFQDYQDRFFALVKRHGGR